MSLKINGEYLEYKKTFAIGIPGIQTSFRIKKSDVRVVGVKVNMSLDPEDYYVFIDKYFNTYVVNIYLIEKDSIDELLEYFSINELNMVYPDDWYTKGHSFIVHPIRDEKVQLFKNWKEDFLGNFILCLKKCFLLVSPGMGILTEKCKEIVTRH